MPDDAAELGERHQRETAEMADRHSQERDDTFKRQSQEMAEMIKRSPGLLKPGYGEGEAIPSAKPIITAGDQGAEINPAGRTRDPGAIVDPTEFMTKAQAKRYGAKQDAANYLREHRPGGVKGLSDPGYLSGKDI